MDGVANIVSTFFLVIWGPKAKPRVLHGAFQPRDIILDGLVDVILVEAPFKILSPKIYQI